MILATVFRVFWKQKLSKRLKMPEKHGKKGVHGDQDTGELSNTVYKPGTFDSGRDPQVRT
jgi:hypothetical protein